MKKVLAVLCVFAALLIMLIGVFLYAWFGASLDDVPKASAYVLGTDIQPDSFEWQHPVLDGFVYRPFSGGFLNNITSAGEAEGGLAESDMVWPHGYDVWLEVTRENIVVYEGEAAGWQQEYSAEKGIYNLTAVCTMPKNGREGYGSFVFRTSFTVPRPPEPPEPEVIIPDTPEFETGETNVQQGDIFSMRILYLPDDVIPVVSTNLGMAVFVPRASEEAGGTEWFCAVPVGNARAPGQYPVKVSAGEHSWEAVVDVATFPFDEQNLVIDVTDPVISEANSPAAYEQYRAKIPPFFDTFDEECYWYGTFIRPAEGRISTQFGAIRYTNGDYSNPRYHTGMDIAAAAGTPVLAPNAGRVVLAEYLLNTGNTIVIEHGGGLKSYYFHMSELHVEEGDMVKPAQLIGNVGTTGYSTGPHLHFEMRIGNQPISPEMLFEDTAGLYAVGAGLEPEEEDGEGETEAD